MAAPSPNPVGGPFSKQISPSPYPTTASSPTHVGIDGGVSPTSGDGQNVLSRLHALFRSDTRDWEPSRRLSIGERLDRCRTGPAGLEVPSQQELGVGAPEVEEREAIKVLLVTWNMGDALPKGDLTVLLGEVPTYEPPQHTDKDALPELSVEHKHPYHIVVVAGQECPTPSGVPRGLGGVMKGMSVRVGHHRKKDKGDKEPEKKDSVDREKDETDSSSEDEDDDPTPRNQSPMPPPTPTPGQKAPAGKGWSTMLDDWFCGPPLKPNLVAHSPTVPSSPPMPPGSSSLVPPSPPSLERSNSAPQMSPTNSFSLSVPKRPPPTPSLHETSTRTEFLAPRSATSPMSRRGSSDSSSPGESLAGDDPGLAPPPDHAAKEEGEPGSSLPVKPEPERPGLIIPTTEVARTGLGMGSYVHVTKERLMGMYLTVYVYKGCEHMVQGVDKDFVTAGLAGGRLGNKGAIGISLKLAEHRFLFVNSHLAAHTKRVTARLANIAKIKSELDLDTFLPKDDPRNSIEDIADRFDSVFWCGDLNFRLDMSRLHAEWLVEQKNYPELLMWDQLRGVMKDPDNNPFPGFQEGEINFPPTFKYDVWKSVKATNRDLRRNLRRNGTIDGKRETGAKEIAKDLAKTLSPITMEDEENEVPFGEREGNGYHTDGAPSRPSFESSVRSTAHGDTDDDDLRSEKHIDASAYGSRQKALEVAIKAKTKKWLSYVKMDNVLTREKSIKRKQKQRDASGASTDSHDSAYQDQRTHGRDFDEVSRRTSMSSFASNHTRLEVPVPLGSGMGSATSPSSDYRPATPQQEPEGPPRRPSVTSSWLSASPPQRTPARRMTLLKRTVSGRSVSTNEHPEPEREEDNREGVYDSSKKQRVPSWCDRVLWKAHVVPDPDELTDDVSVPREKRSSRLSHVFSNLGGHLRSSITRTSSMDHAVQEGRNRSHPATPSVGGTATLVDSPTGTPDLRSKDLPQVPDPPIFGSSDFERGRSTGPVSPGISPLSTTRHPLLDQNTSPSVPSRPTITFDLASPDIEHKAPASTRRTSSFKFRPRSNSDATNIGLKPSLHQRHSDGHHTPPNAHPESSLSHSSPSQTRVGGGHRKASLSPTKPAPDLGLTHAKTQQPAHGDTPPAGRQDRDEQRSAFMKFIRNLPDFLHGRNSVSPSNQLSQKVEPVKTPPRRRQRGEVVCLHYGTIDDQGMRQLEGRSDHRPAIFSAAVYI